MGSYFAQNQQGELAALISAAQRNPTDDSPEMNEIIRRFDGLAIKVARSFTPDHFLQQDLANRARMALVTAVRKHKADRDGFPSYARAFMAGAAQRELGSWIGSTRSQEFSQVRLDDEVDSDLFFRICMNQPGVADRTWGSASTTGAIRRLGPDQQILLEQRFIDDLDLAAIGSGSGTTASAVSQRIATALRGVSRDLAA